GVRGRRDKSGHYEQARSPGDHTQGQALAVGQVLEPVGRFATRNANEFMGGPGSPRSWGQLSYVSRETRIARPPQERVTARELGRESRGGFHSAARARAARATGALGQDTWWPRRRTPLTQIIQTWGMVWPPGESNLLCRQVFSTPPEATHEYTACLATAPRFLRTADHRGALPRRPDQ